MKKATIAKLCILGALTVLFVVLSLLLSNTEVCEFFATTISRWWIAAFGFLSSLFTFSTYEYFLILAIGGGVTCLVFVVIFLAKRRWKKLLSLVLSMAIAVMSFLNIYTATASFAYNREPLPDYVYTEYNSEQFSYEQALDLAQTLVEKANYAYQNTRHDEEGNIVFPFGFDQLSALLAKEYQRLDSDYFSSFTPRGKRIANKWLMSQLHITGVFFAPFGEANVNGNENNLYLPFTLAHEMAHSKGVMREYEADIVAMYVLLTSDNIYLQYSALARAASYAISLVYLYPNSVEDGQNLYAMLDGGIALEKSNYSKFYAQFQLLDDLGKFFNDIYLKLQNQQGGTDSYVKPPQTQGTGQTDDFGQEIVQIVSFSGMQNLLINLYKQQLL